jgi:hypothetical protein
MKKLWKNWLKQYAYLWIRKRILILTKRLDPNTDPHVINADPKHCLFQS